MGDRKKRKKRCEHVRVEFNAATGFSRVDSVNGTLGVIVRCVDCGSWSRSGDVVAGIGDSVVGSVRALERKNELLEFEIASTRQAYEKARDSPPWLSDAAKALGEVRPDGKPLALNWTQVIEAIKDLKRAHDRWLARMQKLEARLDAVAKAIGG